MDTVELFQRLSIALAIGLLIGLERGWQAREDREGERSAGLRTHALASLLGAVWGAISNQTGIGGAVALGLAFVVFSAAITLFRYRETSHDGTFGATTVVAAMLAFALGALAVVGDMQAAIAAGVAATGLLALKSSLHGWMRRLTWPELRSGLVLLAMTCIMLPWLPRRAIDPWAAFNPFEIWLLTVMIAAISFAGYMAVKAIGDKAGFAVTGIAGGFASSTAVTVTMARLAREHPEQQRLFVAGALFASATMMVRVLVLVALVNAALLIRLAPSLGVAGAVLASAGAVFMWRAISETESEKSLDLKNPLDLVAVLKFGILLTVVAALAKLATNLAGSAGAYSIAALAGIADVDAITLSMARLDRDRLGPEAAAIAIGIAVAVNMVSKSILSWWTGGGGFGWRLSLASTLAIASGGLALLLVPTL
jgi:uncharacterized membrane protein (DUF4010 family)